MQFKGQKEADGKKLFLFDTEDLTVVEIAEALAETSCSIDKTAVTYKTKDGTDKTKEIPFEAVVSVKQKHGFDKWSFIVHTTAGDKVVFQLIDSAHTMSMKAENSSIVTDIIAEMKPAFKRFKARAKAAAPIEADPVPVAQLVPSAPDPAPASAAAWVAPGQTQVMPPQAQPSSYDEYTDDDGYTDDNGQGYGYASPQQPRGAHAAAPYQPAPYAGEDPSKTARARHQRRDDGHIDRFAPLPKANMLYLVLACVEALFLVPIPFTVLTFADWRKGEKLAPHDADAARKCFANMKNSVIIGLVFVVLAIVIFVWKVLPVLV